MSIELIVLDVDGTMTKGEIIYNQMGDEIKAFNVKDGLAIESWFKLGKKTAIITGRSSQIVEKRAKELHIEHYYQGVKNKRQTLEMLLEKLNLTMENVAAIGDDLNDLSMLRVAKKSFAPADAVAYVTKEVDVVLNAKGGEGAVREMIERLIVEEGLESQFLGLWQ